MKAPILKGKEIILKPIKTSEAGNYLRWFNDPEINRYLTIDGKQLNLVKEIQYIKNALKSKTKYNWAIYTSNMHIGSTGLELNFQHNKATWGIFIGEKDYHNQGLGTDTLKMILNFCFKRLKLNRVELGVFSYNQRGYRCYEKCGFKFEGVKKQAILKNGKYIDEIMMGILRKDYLKK
jgi:RimJ/RimL family protein N-acetyltransferase